MSMQPKRIVIIGGGISGLSSAYYAQKMCAQQGIPAEITLLEKSEVLGGKIQTLYRDGFVIERGPDSFLARKLSIIDLIKELGLEQELTATNPQAKKTYILKKGRFHRMPPGLVLGIPTQILPFLKTGLISPLGKIRAGFDLFLPRRKLESDESLGSFLGRRLGKEVLHHIAEPLLAGIYAGDTNELSLQTTFPQFHKMEQKYGSLIYGMVRSKKNNVEAPDLPENLKNSMFLTFKRGLQTLVKALIDSLSQVQIKTGQSVESIIKKDKEYHVVLEDGSKLVSDAVVLAIPTYQTAKLLDSVKESLLKVPYVSVANIIMAFNEQDIKHPLDGSGFLVPRTEGRFITACTWNSSKWLHTSPEGKVLIRCYVGRSGQEQWMDLTDEEILSKVRQDLKDLMDLSAAPLFSEITRLYHSMPQYPVGHLKQIMKVREELASQSPGVLLTGAGYHGVGLPDCIRQGKESAEQALLYLKN